MSNLHVFDHPLIQHKLSVLRDKDTGVKVFRELVGEIAMLMCYEATRDLPLEEVEVETPVAVAKCRQIAGKKLAVVPILRSPNMSLGVNLLLKLVRQATKTLFDAGFDIELIEKHHSQKTDAPSGTAVAIAEAINEAAGGSLN